MHKKFNNSFALLQRVSNSPHPSIGHEKAVA